MKTNYKAIIPKSLMAKWNSNIKSESSETTIDILDVIDPYWGISVEYVKARLDEIGDRDITVDINSPGGDTFEGIAIYNLLKAHKGNIKVRVLGLAASSASLIAMAGDTIEMLKGSMIMIHNSWIFAVGNKFELLKQVDLLKKADISMTEIYLTKSALDKEEIIDLMDNETFMTADEAIEKGFATNSIDDTPKKEPSENLNALRTIENALKSQGYTRSEQKELLKKIKSDSDMTRSITPNDKQDAIKVDLSRTISLLEDLTRKI